MSTTPTRQPTEADRQRIVPAQRMRRYLAAERWVDRLRSGDYALTAEQLQQIADRLTAAIESVPTA